MQEKLSKLKYKFKTEVKSGKSGYMLYAAVLAGSEYHSAVTG